MSIICAHCDDAQRSHREFCSAVPPLPQILRTLDGGAMQDRAGR
jgi:hypothetical protein